MTQLQNFLRVAAVAFCLFASSHASAVQLDWKGFFRIDNNYMRNYQMESSAPGNTSVAGASGEYIRGEGEKSATYTTLFARVKPSILINDNIIVYSEWNIGDPVTGFFGRGVPTLDRKNPASTGRGTLPIEAARLWMDAHTDFGLLQLGRAPMHWGLGVIYNAGDEPMDRFQSTSDTIRFISKFGYLSVMPFYSKVNFGKNAAGSQDATGALMQGSDDVTDYGVALRFQNPESEIEAGVLFNKRSAADQQDAYYFPHSTNPQSYATGSNGMNLSLIDVYAKKTWYRLTVGLEVPYYSGTIGNVNGTGKRNSYKATGLALETKLDFDRWHHQLKLGMAPGQGALTTGNRGESYGAMYFHRNYKLGQILFSRNLGGYGSNNPDNPGGVAATSVTSPYDAAIVNAKYIMLGTENRGEHWSWGGGVVYAKADETAKRGKDFYIHRTRTYGTAAAVEDQSDSLGWEVDLNLGYHWDENIRFGADFGLFFPGDFYAFDNLTFRANKTDPVMSIMFSATAKF